jgi:hypothetical protein
MSTKGTEKKISSSNEIKIEKEEEEEEEENLPSCPSHEVYSAINWAPEEWRIEVEKCLTGHVTWLTMSEEDRKTLRRFVISTKSDPKESEGLTWEGTWNMTASFLKYPNFTDCYEPYISEEKATGLINKKIRPDTLAKTPDITESQLNEILERVYFTLIWKLKPVHLQRLKDLASKSGITLKTAIAVDVEARRRIEASYDEENETNITTAQGFKYLFFLYRIDNRTLGRWMIVGHDCSICGQHCDYGRTFAKCSKCENILYCEKCRTHHVCSK